MDEEEKPVESFLFSHLSRDGHAGQKIKEYNEYYTTKNVMDLQFQLCELHFSYINVFCIKENHMCTYWSIATMNNSLQFLF